MKLKYNKKKSYNKQKRLKKNYIISKRDIAYIQNFIIEQAIFISGKDADTIILRLSLNELEKILKKIRKNKKDTLYLNKIKDKSIMDFIIPIANKLMTKKYYSSSRVDPYEESMDSIISTSRLLAAKYFAKRKRLPLREYLKIFKVSK